MKLIFACALFAAGLNAQSIDNTLLALKDSHAPRKALSNQLVEEMMAQAKSNQSPWRSSVQRFAEDLTTALLGKDVTKDRAAEIHKAISGVLSGKGSTFLPANRLYEVLFSCGIEDRTVQAIVDRFTEIGRQVRGPDDMGVRPLRLK